MFYFCFFVACNANVTCSIIDGGMKKGRLLCINNSYVKNALIGDEKSLLQ